MMEENKKLGIALVGLGRYSKGQLGPALKQTQHCYLAGVVSSSTEKCNNWKNEYNLSDKNIYLYNDFDNIKENKDIDIIYVVLPNAMHAEYVIRAAKAGKHVICEKPLATSVEDCHAMIAACKEAGVKLAVGYRLHYDPFHKEMMRLGQEEIFGRVLTVIADDSMVIDTQEWRLENALAGGGPLLNNGVYCVQAALYITGELPVAVNAEFLPHTTSSRASTVEEGIRWEMEFASGKRAICESSYSKDGNLLHAEAEHGWFQLEPAYEYKGLKGKTPLGEIDFPAINQQAAQMDDFALCIKNNTESKVPGEMGLRDVEIMMAIYESARTGKKVVLQLNQYENLIEV
jgi:predicted dehydrogenase